jgi:hypothetical protein
LHQDQLRYQPCESDIQINSQENKSLSDDFNLSALLEQIAQEQDELNPIDEAYTTLFIAEEKLHECPKLEFTIADEEITSILDTGSKLCLMSQDMYNNLRNNGMKN